MNTWVVDASVLIKTLINEPGNEIAVGIWTPDERFIAPMSAVPEAANALLRKVRHEGLPENAALDALIALGDLPVTCLPLYSYQARSLFALARSTGLTAHDCAYLLLAEDYDARIVTADMKMIRGCAAAPRWKERVVSLANWPG